MSFIGQSIARREGKDKLTGASQYIADLSFPGMIFGTTVRSSLPRGYIRGIYFDNGVPWNEVTVVTARDIPADNYVAVIEKDQPLLAETSVNHTGEAIVLLAHPDRIILEKAKSLVRIDIEPLCPVLDIESSLSGKQIIWGKDNVLKSYEILKGNVDSTWNKAPRIVEGTYTTETQEQLYLENHGMIAVANPSEGVTVWGSLQCPYYVHKALKTAFGLPPEKVRVIQTETGGGFGGKEDYPSIIGGHAALLAWKSGKPVKLVYDRREDMAVTTKRHPSRTHIRTAHESNGRLISMDIKFVLDGGAYSTLSSVVLSRGTLHATGPYFCPNVRIQSKALATNVPPHGAFRGFGAPQSLFAIERHMNKAASALQITPEQIRRINFLKKNQTTATGQIIDEDVDFDRLMDIALEQSHYHEKISLFGRENSKNKIKRGIGFSSFMHGAGFTGSGEKFLASVVAAEADANGKIIVLSSSTEIGQGTQTVFSQIAASTLGLSLEDIRVAQPDTGVVPDSGPTVASRTSMVVGKLVESACLGIRESLIRTGLLKNNFTHEEFISACRLYHDQFGPLKCTSQYQQPPHILWDDKAYRGDAYATFAWAVYVAEVSVDTITYETTVEDFVAVQEIGNVINPTLAEGQIEGGVVQGIGYALYEKVLWKNGKMLNNQMTNYIIPTASDIPKIKVFFEEKNRKYGPNGSKGIGELPMDGPAPAILNAVENAVDISSDHIPMLPEDLMSLLEKGECKHG